MQTIMMYGVFTLGRMEDETSLQYGTCKGAGKIGRDPYDNHWFAF